LNPQVFLLVSGQHLQAAAFMVLFKSETFAVACSLTVGNCQSGKDNTDDQNATDDDDDVFLFHDNLLKVCYYLNFTRKRPLVKFEIKLLQLTWRDGCCLKIQVSIFNNIFRLKLSIRHRTFRDLSI
jgi:hypothetical protein